MARKTPVGYSESFRAALLAGLMMRPHPDVRSPKGIRQSTPVVARIDSWGPNSNGERWDYTRRPAVSRYKYGSASGGMMFLPPEYHAALADASFTGILTPSTTYYAVAGGASWGAGLPLLASGLLGSGYSWRDVSGALDFFVHSSVGVPSNAVRFTAGGDIGFRSGTGYWGTLAHANTADRTYTFPDKDGTVAMTSDLDGTLKQCSLRRTTNQSIAAGAYYAIEFDAGSEVTDTDNMHDTVTDNSRIKCVTEGTYLIGFSLYFVADAVGWRSATVKLNDTTYLIVDRGEGAASPNATYLRGLKPIHLSADDYLELLVYHDSTTDPLDVGTGDAYSPIFFAIRIGQ